MKATINAVIVRKNADLRDIVEEIKFLMSKAEIRIDEPLREQFFLKAVDIVGDVYEIGPNLDRPSTVYIKMEDGDWSDEQNSYSVLCVQEHNCRRVEALANPKRVLYFRLEK